MDLRPSVLRLRPVPIVWAAFFVRTMARWSEDTLISGVLKSETRAVARLISLLEDGDPVGRSAQARLFPRTGKAQVVGVTGPPGAGKSTLVDQLAEAAKRRGRRVGILAIDPSSPFSGGAVLGDRVRMVKTSEDPHTYIRSMATRGALGGIARATVDAVLVLDAAGFDLIFIETVGVGQVEVDIARLADTCIVVMVPGMGDSVQALKAGILEIADLFVINKADRPGVDLLAKDLHILLTLVESAPDGWKPPILPTVATSGEGIETLIDDVTKHREWLTSSQEGSRRREQLIRDTILKMTGDVLLERAVTHGASRLDALVRACLARERDPWSASQELASLV